MILDNKNLYLKYELDLMNSRLYDMEMLKYRISVYFQSHINNIHIYIHIFIHISTYLNTYYLIF